ncbi:MAG: Zn-dependent hydrolase, glyoxylase, partial [Akkermansiaceae bacterium]|nr:Zn-dependent hydrolase, glyoxylase [Akkermansiaceae bacterium]
PVRVDREIKDGDLLPVVDGGLEVIHVPGHCSGQVALRWERHGGVLFAADACVNQSKEMEWAPSYEDLEEGRRSLRKLAGLEFEVACFGHGAPIVGGAKAGFVRKWG